MSKQTKRLGRGLDSLMTADSLESAAAPVETVVATETPTSRVGAGHVDALMLRPDALSPNPFQPRRDRSTSDVGALADSIRASGMIQPIVARRSGNVLQIVAGERRWRAARLAGLERVPVLVREADDRQMLEMALIENVQRADLNAMDRARGYERLCEEFGLSAEEVGRLVGEDRTTVTNYIRLLELPREVKELVSSGGISMGHARCLLGVDRLERQMQLAKATVENELSVRALEETVRRERSERSKAVAPVEKKATRSAHVADMESRFQEALGTKVTIRPSRRKERGRIIIEYNSLDDFDRIASALGVELE